MDKILLLTQLIKNGEFENGSSSVDSIALEQDFSPIFETWMNHEDYYVLHQYEEQEAGDPIENPLYTKLTELLNNQNQAEISKQRVVCYTNSTYYPGAQVILDGFKSYTDSRGDSHLISNIHYMNSGYNYQGVIEGEIFAVFGGEETSPAPIHLSLNTDYGVFNLRFEVEPK